MQKPNPTAGAMIHAPAAPLNLPAQSPNRRSRPGIATSVLYAVVVLGIGLLVSAPEPRRAPRRSEQGSSRRPLNIRALSPLWVAAVNVTVSRPASGPPAELIDLRDAVDELSQVIWPDGRVLSRWFAFWPALATHDGDEPSVKLTEEAAALIEACVAVLAARPTEVTTRRGPWRRLAAAADDLAEPLMRLRAPAVFAEDTRPTRRQAGGA